MEAMKLFVDRSQLPGPRSWINQEFPEVKEIILLLILPGMKHQLMLSSKEKVCQQFINGKKQQGMEL